MIPTAIPMATHIPASPVVNTKPVYPNNNQADSPVALSQNAKAHPGNFFPPKRKSSWFLTFLLSVNPIIEITTQYNKNSNKMIFISFLLLF